MIFFLVIGNLSLFARKNVQLTSPNGKLKFSLTLSENIRFMIFNIKSRHWCKTLP